MRAKNSLRAGAIMNVDMFAIEGRDCSFRNSFRASAIGWGSPMIDTLFGPLRVWIYPRILRSRRVKKAIASSAER